ncbi:hypothetical protein [Allofournierella massiliensis]|uniref:hypothetical protein n=1 Tax=Allofournierella massiliensis TaxID=1650663 RepID=UPI00320B01ED
MQHPEWWNLMSIFLGLAALVLPPLGGALLARKGRRWHWCIAVSLAACAISLYGWIAYTRYLVEIQNFSALLDTQPAGQMVSGALLLAVLLVNGVTAAILETRPGASNAPKRPEL